MLFFEFCHSLELIEKSGKNGAKQRHLDVLWDKVHLIAHAHLHRRIVADILRRTAARQSRVICS